MGKQRYDANTKNAVKRMRSRGATYAEIRGRFSIPKSTLSAWLGKEYPLFTRTKQLQHLRRIRKLSAQSKNATRQAREKNASEAARSIALRVPAHDVDFEKSMLSMLYWAEGTKFKGVSSLKFVNTDPRMVLFYVTVLRKTYPIDETRLRVRIHLHHYHDRGQVLGYWSNLLRIPLSQFGKVYVKKRSETKKFRPNFMGICFVTYGDISILREVMALSDHLFGKVVPAELTARLSP